MERRPHHNLMYNVDHTFGFCSKNFIRACGEIFCACSQYRNQRRKFETFGNNHGTHKVMDGLPLTRKVAYRRQTVIKRQGRFTKCGLPRTIPPAMWMGYNLCIEIYWLRLRIGRFQKCVHQEIVNAEPYRIQDSAFQWTPLHNITIILAKCTKYEIKAYNFFRFLACSQFLSFPSIIWADKRDLGYKLL